MIASAIKLAVFLIAGALRSVAGIDDPPTVLIPPATAVHCAEDDPCWDCATMGNQVCGTSTRGSGTF